MGTAGLLGVGLVWGQGAYGGLRLNGSGFGSKVCEPGSGSRGCGLRSSSLGFKIGVR